MKEKILYYLGAGASANGLPIARSFPSKGNIEIPGLAHNLRTINLNPYVQELTDERNRNYVTNITDRFRSLADKADEFGDVDTYAKYLHLMQPGGKELQDLKKTLSEYFSIEQLLAHVRDPRYLPWLVSLMDNRLFPDNVKILTWNYDFQVELAASRIGDLEDINHRLGSFTYSPSMLLHYPTLDPTFSEFHRLSLIHLNGIAGFERPRNLQSGSAFQKIHSQNPNDTISFFSKEFTEPLLHFAWEKSDYHNKLMEHIKTVIDGVTILVVIGYSFPFFNRDVDKAIFKMLTSQQTFRKIYYQDPKLNGQQLKSQFELASKFDIVHIESKDNFHIPFEY